MMDPIEAAARAICEADVLSPGPDAPIIWGGKQAKAWEPRAAILRQAVEAGLFCHPPKAWVGPIDAETIEYKGMVVVCHPALPAHVWDGTKFEPLFARDAHTKEQT